MPSYGARLAPTGSEQFMFYPTTNQRFDVSASAVINGVTFTGSLQNAPASGSTYDLHIPGTVDMGL